MDCSALIKTGRGYGMYAHRCKNGFPVQPACFDGVPGLPICCNEVVCARLYPEMGRAMTAAELNERETNNA
jgi:hypothetical protein